MTRVSQTTATLQVVNNPMLNKQLFPEKAVKLFDALHDLQADLVRYVPWFPYPRGGVAELDPPNFTDQTTSWNFPEELQQPFLDTVHAVTTPVTVSTKQEKQKRIVINFSTQPTWMFNTSDWSYPVINNTTGNATVDGKCDWSYPRGGWIPASTQLVADYYGRLASWMVLGYFDDEFGNHHDGGPALGLEYVTHWEIFNEPEAEHSLSWRDYNRMYDAIVRAIRSAVDPHHRIQFFGMSLEGHEEWEWWEGFLNLENHAPDAQDAVTNGYASFHWYGHAGSRTNVSTFQDPFAQMAKFLEEVDCIIAIRDRLSPTTKLAVNEAGVIPPNDNTIGADPSPPIYYNSAAAVVTVLVAELSLKGVDIVGSSQFCGCPDLPLVGSTTIDRQFPGVSMTNWTSATGNPRYWVLKLFLQYFGPGDQIVSSEMTSSMLGYDIKDNSTSVYVQARISKKNGKHAMIVVNKSHRQKSLSFQGLVGALVNIVDETTHDGPWKEKTSKSDSLLLEPFAVAVVEVNEVEMGEHTIGDES